MIKKILKNKLGKLDLHTPKKPWAESVDDFKKFNINKVIDEIAEEIEKYYGGKVVQNRSTADDFDCSYKKPFPINAIMEDGLQVCGNCKFLSTFTKKAVTSKCGNMDSAFYCGAVRQNNSCSLFKQGVPSEE